MVPARSQPVASEAVACPAALIARPAVLSALTSRPSRVVILGALIGVMSVIDLYLTLLYLTHTGMAEANPLARAIIAYQSPFVLAVWKMLTVVLSVGILFLIRHKRSAELGAWVGAVVLGMLMSHWTRYIDESAELKTEIAPVAAQFDENWVHIDPAAIGPMFP